MEHTTDTGALSPSKPPEIPDTPGSLSKADVLAFLDWEISTASGQQNQFGTSSWSLVGALAGTLWLLLSEAHYKWTELPPLGYLVVGYFLISDLLAMLYDGASISTPELEHPKRVMRPSLIFGFRRRNIVFEILRLAALTAIVLHLGMYLSRGQQLVTAGYFVLLDALLVLIWLLSLVHIELVPDASKNETKWLSPVAMGSLFIAQVVVLTVFLNPFWAKRLEFQPADHKNAILVVIASFLLNVLLSTRGHAAMTPFLTQLRREVSTGELSPQAAASEAMAKLSGLSVKDYVSREFNKHKDLLKRMTAALERLSANIDEIDRQEATSLSTRAVEFLDEWTGLLRAIDRIEKNEEYFRKKVEKLAQGRARDEVEREANVLIDHFRSSLAIAKGKHAALLIRPRALTSANIPPTRPRLQPQ